MKEMVKQTFEEYVDEPHKIREIPFTVDGKVAMYQLWYRPEVHEDREYGGSPHWWVAVMKPDGKADWIEYHRQFHTMQLWDFQSEHIQDFRIHEIMDGMLGSDTEITNYWQFTIRCHYRMVHRFTSRDFLRGTLECLDVIDRMKDHYWFKFDDPESMIGKDVWYKEVVVNLKPVHCYIHGLQLDRGCVTLKRKDGLLFPESGFREARDFIVTDILDPDLKWYDPNKED